MTHGPMPALLAAVAITVVSASAVSSQQAPPVDRPLTEQQLEDAMKVLTPRRVASLIQKFGSTFILDAEAERRLRAAAAAASEKLDGALLEEIIRLLAPPRKPSAGTEWIAPTDGRRMVWIPQGA